MRSYYLILLLMVFILSFCAHKAPPLHIDRVNPKLIRINPFSENQLILNFSEELDSLSLNPENFLIYSEQETIKIICVTPGHTPDQVFLFTPGIIPGEYNLIGKVYDRSERAGFFKTKFIASTKKDTVPPLVIKYTKGARQKNFYLEYSEPIDTASIKYYVFPRRKMVSKWYYMKMLSLIPETDSLNHDTTYYLFVKEAKDLSGNDAPQFITTITSDSVYNPIFIRGRAVLNDTPIISGLGVISRKEILGISTIDHGEFLFEVRDSFNYYLQILGDDCHGADSVSVSRENIIKLTPGKVDFDSIIN
ncbi:MAG: hypothetical protein N3A65_01265 [candidate division WOR-3 bacterium]|nr:hypothetical protein [candidate division WOR-3 bacterium]